MNNHQAIGHMRSLMHAQHALNQAILRAKSRDAEAARKFVESALKAMNEVKDALAKVGGELTTPVSMLRLLFDDLNRQRVDVVEKELLILEKAARASKRAG